ncbi:MAG: hypothetical protein ABIP35_12720 [Ginsengibacter sp.]
MKNYCSKLLILVSGIFFFNVALGQVEKTPPHHEGEGPWSQLIIRGVILINGTLAPPVGPVDIVVEGNRIVKNATLMCALRENKKLGLRSKMHHSQTEVGRWNALQSARAGLTSMEHWYGLPEALFTDRTVQNYSLDYNYSNEFDRFGEAGELWKQAAPPYSDHWNKVMNEMISLDFTMCPTFVIYSASRGLMLARRAEWHEDYTLPVLWDFFSPAPSKHGSYWDYPISNIPAV